MCCMRTAMDVSNEASSEVQPSDVASFAVGDTFSSYDDLKKKLAEFEKSHSVQLTQFGGKKYNNKGSGKRPHQRYTELVDY